VRLSPPYEFNVNRMIKSIKPIAVRLPMKKPVIMAGEEVRAAENLLVRIEDADGLIGWGEAASAPVMTGETLASMSEAVRTMAPALLGRDPRDIAGAHAAMDGKLYGNHAAKGAIEIALLDLAGRAEQKPVHALLGAKKRQKMALLTVIGGGDYAGDLDDAAKKKAAGYAAFKIKVGIDTAEKDAARSRDICKVLGSGLLISADANQGFDTEQACAYARAMQGSGLDFFEQPVDGHDLDGMAKVAAAANGIALGADEGIHSLEDIVRHHDRKAAKGVSLKAIKLGGLTGVLKAGELCERLGMNVNLACKTGESSIACAAALHVASVLPGIAWGLTLTNSQLAEDVAGQGVQTARGHVEALDTPGLGIDVDEERVRTYRA
jgi:L-alanine-DL-glutamate epimerase-like enolase superfamily enzyme